MPYLLDILGHEPGHNFTAVIFVQIGVQLTPSSALYRLVKSITKSQFVDRVSTTDSRQNVEMITLNSLLQLIIIWASDRPIPSKKKWPNTGSIPLHIVSSIVNDERLVERRSCTTAPLNSNALLFPQAYNIPKILPTSAYPNRRCAVIR